MDHPAVNISPYRSSFEDTRFSEGIDCPSVGMITPVESCESRLNSKDKSAKCSYGPDCPRFVGEKVDKVEKVEKAVVTKTVINKNLGRPRTNMHEICQCCDGKARTRTGKEPVMKAHRLCSVCYSFHRQKKTMDQWRNKEAKT
jgi:hypothetical protein